MQDDSEREEGATFLELFFDLVFVFAVTQVAAYILHEGNVEAYLRASLIFALVWWAWEQFTWAGNGVELTGRPARAAMLAATIAAFFMAQGLAGAFTTEGEWFSVPFAAAMGIGLSLYWWGLRREREHQRALISYLPLTVAGMAVAAVGGFTAAGVQPWMYFGAFLLFIAAGKAAQFGTPFHIYPKHFSERHALIVIVALGESVVAVGVASGGLDRSGEFAFAVLAGMAAACLLWWSYFDWFQESAEHFMRQREPHQRTNLARDIYAWAHLPIIFGVVLIAVAAEGVVGHPREPLDDVGRVGLAAGTAMFQLGIAVAHWRACREVLIERMAGAALTVALVAVLASTDALVLMLAATAVIAVALAAEWVRHAKVGMAHER